MMFKIEDKEIGLLEWDYSRELVDFREEDILHFNKTIKSKLVAR